MEYDELNSLLDSLSTPVLYLRPNSTITYINNASEELLGISQQRAYNKKISDLLYFNNLQKTLDWVISQQESVILQAEASELPLSHNCTLDYNFTPVIQHDQVRAIIVELNESEVRLRLVREEYLKNQHEASHEAIRGLAHEIKNPLSGIKGAAQLLEQDIKSYSSDNNPDELTEYTQIIIAETDRLHALVSRMLHPVDDQPVEYLNIHEIIEYIVVLTHMRGTESIHMMRDYDPSIPPLKGNANQLKQIFLNIISNALNALGDEGTIQLVTRVLRQVVINQQLHRLAIKVDIIDDGPGVPEHLVDKIFFPMVSGSDEGTGLGLSIAQELMNRHGGSISYQRLNEHTCFSLLIPVEYDATP